MVDHQLEEFAGAGVHKIPHWMSSLEEELDKRLIVLLRDGRKFVGWLRCFDQYANLMLEATHERFVEKNFYADHFVGNVIIRGENVVLFGALDEQHEQQSGALKEKPFGEILSMQQERQEQEAASGRKARLDLFEDV
mmetsp:Transcript_48131/g.95005  ORF Transcript_48131/g.95005 Transcript_48131/m.95005 type:complete len:137 (-) Transcript_48131:118-528(-)